MSDLPSRDDLLKAMGLTGGHAEPANILHTTAEHLRMYLPAASPDFVLDVALGLLDLLDQEHDENAAMRPIVEAVARGRLVRGEFPHEEWIDPDEIGAGELIIAAIQASALLAKESQE